MVKRLIGVLIGVFLAQLIIAASLGGYPQYDATFGAWTALDLRQILRGWLWQPFTYMFVHSANGWGHVVFNCLALYFFGSAVEESIGKKALVKVFIGAGLAGALAVMITQAIAMGVEGWSVPRVVGASGAISGIGAVFCWLHWRREIYVFIFRVTGKQLFLFLIVADLLSLAARFTRNGGDNIAVQCHAGGMLFGLLWVTGRLNPKTLILELKRWRLKRRLKVVHSRDPEERGPYMN
ncbi:MAG: membrane associated rhomboid family serine protease [Bradymonadia bacterium]|jgi:membrane associated rhomboid family serine protease